MNAIGRRLSRRPIAVCLALPAGGWRRVARAAVQNGLAILLVFALGAQLVSAHATLLRADPPPNSVLSQSPPGISLWFDEALDPRFSAVSLLDTTQTRVDLNDLRFSDDRKQMLLGVRPNRLPGAYTVAWRAVSLVDGHVTRDAYAIYIGAASAAQRVPIAASAATAVLPLPLDVAARWLNLLAALALCGALTLNLLMGDAGERFAALRAATGRRLRLWVVFTLLVLFAGAIAAQLLQAAAASDRGLDVVVAQSLWLQTLTTTRFGQAALARIVLVGALLVLFVAVETPRRGVPAERRISTLRLNRLANVRGLDALYVSLSALILLTFSLASHSAASPDPLRLAPLMDWLHLVAIGAWTGGLFALAIVPARARILAVRTDSLLVLLRRFSNLAIAAFALFTLTGLYAAWRQVGYPNALATAYGETLVAKLVLIIPLLLIGALNTLLLRPEWARVAASSLVRGGLLRAFRGGGGVGVGADLGAYVLRAIRLEAALGALVVLAAATLTALPPARSAAPPPLPPPFELTRSAAGVNVSLKVDPYVVGADTFSVRVADPQGAPLPDVTGVSLRFTFLGADLGTASQAMQPAGNGAYQLQGAFLNVIGAWNLEAVVRRSDVPDDLRLSYRLSVIDPVTSRAEEIPNVNSSVVFALFDIVAGVALLAYSRRRHFAEGKWIGAGALALGVALFALGTVFAPSVSAGLLVNPIAPDDVSLADGRRIFDANCAVCHGATGRGNGPLAASLNPRPADLVQHVNLHPDDVLFQWLGDGIPGTAMPPFKDTLSETDRWNVLNYIQATFGQSVAPAPQSTPALQVDARALLARSDEAMNRLRALSEVQRLAGDTGLVVTATFHYVAPDRLQFSVSNGNESIAISGTQYYREPGKPWEKVQRVEPLRWPQFNYAAQASDVKLEGEELIDGEPSAIVYFKAPNVDYYRHWIDERTGLLRRQQMEAPGHHMLSTFAQFDEPYAVSAPDGQ